ncbi:hypothetical protein VTK26DRAFT_2116 [Humicola hyalothermophila]
MTPPVTALAFAFTITTSAAAADIFDYIIVGAGTSGLVVANRLSEDPSVSVAVIEPGNDERDNVNVTGTDKFMQAFGTAIDWSYKTTPQLNADGRVFDLHQGKAWGGTSTINGMTYIRGNVAEFDAWEMLGNPGWNWAGLFPYFKKSERYIVPGESQLAAGATYEARYHGNDGPLHVGYPPGLRNGSFAPPITQTWTALSLPHNPDLNGGDVRGFSIGPQTLDPGRNIRWDAARAYYHPVEHRRNLKMIRGTVKRISWAKRKQSGKLIATGVGVLDDEGKTTAVRARKEVIVSAGALRTPLVLEASGIGNPRILRALGIEPRVNLPGVGENLVEQPSHLLFFAGALEPSASAYHTYVTAADLFGDNLGAVKETVRANLGKWARAAVESSEQGSLEVEALEKLLRIQHNLIFERNVTVGEILTVTGIPGDASLASNYWILHPFSRGNVHLRSLDDINDPAIDLRIFLADFDVSVLTAVGRFAKKFWFTEPVKTQAGVTGPPVVSGITPLPNNATDAQWDAHLRETIAANSHPVGTASMMPRELGGVVDPELRVYGTANVRIVDASVLPSQISGHLTAALYAVSERASDIIRKTRRHH